MSSLLVPIQAPASSVTVPTIATASAAVEVSAYTACDRTTR